MRLMSSRASRVTFGRPPFLRDFQRQKIRELSRCHRTTVSGFTMARAWDQRDQS